MTRLLLVEDDPLISRTLKLSLHYRGFEVTVCDTLAKGLSAFEGSEFDIVVLDVNLPDGTSYSLCKTLKTLKPETPVVMLTARVDESSAVTGIDSGADDYVRKPFGLEELTARLNRLVTKKSGADRYEFNSLRISLKQRQAWVGEVMVALGKREFDILTLLIKRKGEVVSREEILTAVDTESEMFDRTIDSHLSHLRRKLKEAHLLDVQISPVYGVGYRLEKK
jgi:DNA-binding response OmpR family regulator